MIHNESTTVLVIMFAFILATVLSSALANDIILGKEGGKLIWDEYAQATPFLWPRSEIIAVGTRPGEVIQKIEVVDQYEGKTGNAVILEGGVGDDEVVVELRSKVFRGYEFRVKVYAVEDNRPISPIDSIAAVEETNRIVPNLNRNPGSSTSEPAVVSSDQPVVQNSTEQSSTASSSLSTTLSTGDPAQTSTPLINLSRKRRQTEDSGESDDSGESGESREQSPVVSNSRGKATIKPAVSEITIPKVAAIDLPSSSQAADVATVKSSPISDATTLGSAASDSTVTPQAVIPAANLTSQIRKRRQADNSDDYDYGNWNSTEDSGESGEQTPKAPETRGKATTVPPASEKTVPSIPADVASSVQPVDVLRSTVQPLDVSSSTVQPLESSSSTIQPTEVSSTQSPDVTTIANDNSTPVVSSTPEIAIPAVISATQSRKRRYTNSYEDSDEYDGPWTSHEEDSEEKTKPPFINKKGEPKAPEEEPKIPEEEPKVSKEAPSTEAPVDQGTGLIADDSTTVGLPVEATTAAAQGEARLIQEVFGQGLGLVANDTNSQ